MNRIEVGFIIVAVAAVIGALVLVTVLDDNGVNIAQALLTLALVIVTAIYAMRTAAIAQSTKEQAKASIKMAEEMKEQRYDSFLPIIDIICVKTTPSETMIRAYEENPPNEINCILRNVGVGPALDVYSFVQPTPNDRHHHHFDTIETGKETKPLYLSLEKINDSSFIVAYYKDVYGRCFESRREVKTKTINPEPLNARNIACEELP